MNSMKLLSGLESELLWIDNYFHYYRDKQHAEKEKKNIYTRYKLNDMLNKLNRVLK